MKRILLTSFVLWITVLVAAVVALNLGVFHGRIERAIAEKTGAEVKLGPLSFIPQWPLSLDVGVTEMENQVFKIAWKSLSLRLSSLTPPYQLGIKADEPRFESKADMSAGADRPSQGGGVTIKNTGTPFGLKLQVTNGDFAVKSVALRGVNVDFEQRIFLQTVARIHLKALVEPLSLPFKIPLTVDSDSLTLTGDTIKSGELKVAVGGLSAQATGTSFLAEDRHRWRADVDAPDLSKLPPLDFPATDWRGAVKLKVELVKDGPSKNWSADGDVQADNVSTVLKYRQDKLNMQGPLRLTMKTHFQYVDSAPVISNLNANLDLTSAQITYQDMVQKAPDVPLRIQATGQGDADHLQLQNLDVQFWKFAFKVLGKIRLKAPFESDLRLDLPSASLAGAEKILLPLAKSPVTGEVGLNASVQGPLANPKAAHITVNSLKLGNFTADVNYSSPGVYKAVGPVKVSLEGHIEVDKSAVKRAEAKGQALLTDTALVLGPLRKEAKQNLSADFQVRNAGETLEIQNLALDSFFGRTKISGRLTNIFDPTVQLKIDVQALNLSELRIALPDFHDKIPKGTLNGNLGVSGKRQADKPWNDWPLAVDGNVSIGLPEYTLISAAKEEKAAPPPSVKGAPDEEAFLPAGRLTNQLKLKVSVDIGTLNKDKLQVKEIHAAGMIAGGHFKGSADIKEIFSGHVQVSKLDVPLLDKRPSLQGAVNWREIVVQDALAFVKPEYKEFASGRTAGTTEFMTYMPGDAGFLPALKAKGEMNLQPVTLNTVKIGQMLNDLAKQLPMVKLQPVKVEPFKGAVKVQFNMHDQMLQIEAFDGHDLNDSELQLKGKVNVPTLQGDLIGDFFWAQPQVKGCLLEGNSDAKGRMIIPVAIKGNLMQPGLSTLSDLISKLGAKTLQCEQKKLVEKIKKQGTEQLENEVKKKLQGLFGN